MISEFTPWQLVLLLVLFPAVGAYFICTRDDISRWIKIVALTYCAVAFIVILSLRRPVGDVIINAEPLP